MATMSAADCKDAGTSLYKEGDFAKAGGKYAEALGLLPPPPSSAADEELRQKLRLNLAQCYLKLSSFRAAEEQCDAALAVDAGCAKALFRRGQARIGRDALPEALADLLAACKLDPKSRELRAEYDELKNLTAAHPTLPNRLGDLRVVEEKALRQLHTGRADDALRTFALIQRECDSDTVEVQLPQWEARAALGMGSAHRHAGRRAEAREAFERALDRAISEHARAPVLAVYATISLCLLASDAPAGEAGARALAQLASTLVAANGLGDRLLAAAAHGALACALLRAGRPRDALAPARDAIVRSSEMADAHGEAVDLITLSAVERRLVASEGATLATAAAAGADGASAQLTRALEIARALKYPRLEAEALAGLASARLARDDARDAAEFAAEAVRLSRAYRLPLVEAGALGALGAASLALAQRRLAPPDGAELLSADTAFERAAQLADCAAPDDDGGHDGGRLGVALRANAYGARLVCAAAEPDERARAALLVDVQKQLASHILKAREHGLLEVRALRGAQASGAGARCAGARAQHAGVHHAGRPCRYHAGVHRMRPRCVRVCATRRIARTARDGPRPCVPSLSFLFLFLVLLSFPPFPSSRLCASERAERCTRGRLARLAGRRSPTGSARALLRSHSTRAPCSPRARTRRCPSEWLTWLIGCACVSVQLCRVDWLCVCLPGWLTSFRMAAPLSVRTAGLPDWLCAGGAAMPRAHRRRVPALR